MGVIFDTTALIALERGTKNIDDLIRGRENVPFGISAVTVAELLHGVHRADTEERRLRRQAFVEKIIEIFPVFPFDVAAARIYARIWASLAARGRRTGAHDLMIASTVISVGYTLLTSNAGDYAEIEGLSWKLMP